LALALSVQAQAPGFSPATFPSWAPFDDLAPENVPKEVKDTTMSFSSTDIYPGGPQVLNFGVSFINTTILAVQSKQLEYDTNII